MKEFKITMKPETIAILGGVKPYLSIDVTFEVNGKTYTENVATDYNSPPHKILSGVQVALEKAFNTEYYILHKKIVVPPEEW